MKDETIVQLLWKRSEQGLEILHKTYGAFLLRLAMNFLSNRQDSEECVNDAYLKTWNSIPDNRPENLKLYVGRLLRNLAIDRLRHNNAFKRGKQVTILLSELEDCIPAHDTVEASYQRQCAIDCLNRYVASLEPVNQNIFVHRYWLGESLDKISKQTGLPPQTLSSKLFRMRKELKQKLETECF